MKNNGKTTSVYSIVTDRIISQMEKGIIPWIKPWDHVGPVFARNAITKKPYSLMNQMLLGMSGGYWLTYKQLTERNGTLNKGAKSSIVVFYKMNEYEKTDDNGNAIVNENGEAEKKRIPMLRYYKVFNVLDTSLAEQYVNIAEERNNEAIDDAEKIISGYVAGSGIGFYNKDMSNEAYYSPSEDYVKVPVIDQFDNVAEYYSTVFHEFTHSTGHPDRLDRLTKTHFGSSKYAKEELVAEMGAAFALATIGIDNKQSQENNVAYLQSWIKELEKDDHLIVSAASMAEKAVNFIMDTAESADIEDEEETKTPETVPTKKTPRRPSAQSKTSKEDKKVRKAKKNAEKKEEIKKHQEKVTETSEEKNETPAETPAEPVNKVTETPTTESGVPLLIDGRIQEWEVTNPFPNIYKVSVMINNALKMGYFNHEPSKTEIEKAFGGKFMEGESK